MITIDKLEGGSINVNTVSESEPSFTRLWWTSPRGLKTEARSGDYSDVAITGTLSKESINGIDGHNRTELVSIEIGETVTDIGEGAFKDCELLVSVAIPSSLETIDPTAFNNCTSLQEIEVDEENNTYIMVDDCFLLTKDGTSVVKVITNNMIQELTMPNGVVNIDDCAFYGCSSLTSVTIPDTVTNIGDNAFDGCSGLTSLTLPDSVTTIGESAFSACCNLTSVSLGNNIEHIGAYAFDTTGLTTIQIPSSVTYIGADVFHYCNNLTEITIDKTQNEVGSFDYESWGLPNAGTIHCEDGDIYFIGSDGYTTINYTAECGIEPCTKNISGELTCNMIEDTEYVETINIGTSVSSIGKDLFKGCEYLKSVHIADNGASQIKENAFSGCVNLSYVYIGNMVYDIDKGAFQDCANLTDLTIGKNTTNIGENAFSGCDNLKHVELPGGIASIGENAFNCDDLYEITIEKPMDIVHKMEDQLKKIGLVLPFIVHCLDGILGIGSDDDCCDDCCDDLYDIPSCLDDCCDDLYDIPSCLDDCCDDCCDDEGNTKVWYTDGSKWSDDIFGTMNRSDIPNVEDAQKVEIGDLVTEIGEGTFENCWYLSKVSISNTVNLIGRGAFKGCQRLKSIEIPTSVIQIADEAFSESGLLSITIPDSVSYLGRAVFKSCSKLLLATLGKKVNVIMASLFEDCCDLVKVVVPYDDTELEENNLTYIMERAFYHCISLKELPITDRIKHIGDHAFEGCVSLTGITQDDLPRTIGISESPTVERMEEITRTIQAFAFKDCTGLTSVTLSDNITYIGDSAFEGCTSLTDLRLCNNGKYGWDQIWEDNKQAYGSNVFKNCTSLENLDIMTGSHVVPGMFDQCNKIKKIQANKSVICDFRISTLFPEATDSIKEISIIHGVPKIPES